MTRVDRILQLADALSPALESIVWSAPIAYCYNPLRYARDGFAQFTRRALADNRPRRVLFVGLNPGPHGAVQTGVPFGDPGWARSIVGIHVRIDQPPEQHPDRPVYGITATRSETSGRRLWDGLTRMWSNTLDVVPDDRVQAALTAVLSDAYVMNYCPLALFSSDGKNKTPDDLRKLGPRSDFDHLVNCCDAHLRDVVLTLQPEHVVGIGGYAHQRVDIALGNATRVKVSKMLHPSPQSSQANRGWFAQARAQLQAAGVLR